MTGYVLAIDVGGTKAESALVNASGQLLDGTRFRAPTGPNNTPEKFRATLREIISQTLDTLPADGELIGAGAASAGPVNRADGTVFPVNMPGVHGFSLRDESAAILRELGHDIVPEFALDGQALALAESWLGATKDAKSSYAFVVSTGIGGGFVIDGRIMQGASGNAGHLGQMIVEGSGIGVEPTASGPASVAWAQSQGWEGATGEELARDARTGNETARAAIVRSATAVGHTVMNAVHLMDLDVIAVGGGFSFVSDDYVDLVYTAAMEYAQLYYSYDVKIVRSALGGDGPLVGAAALFLRK